MIGLTISHLSKSFHESLFQDFTISVEGRTVIGLIGDNGSGKSTLLKILAGEESSEKGSFQWSIDSNVGYLPQELISKETLSGGQKKILEIRKLIFNEKRNVILLDEPDNHLDIENKLWLENVIKNFDGLVIIISHDRKLLAEITTRVWLVRENRVTDYDFGYAKFVDFYQQELEDRYHLFKTQDKERQRLEEMVAMLKIRAAKSLKLVGQYHSTQKRLEKFKAQMSKPPEDPKNTLGIKIDLKDQHARKTAIFAQHISKSYGEKDILKDTKFHLFCGEKIAIMGANGRGKSTMMKIIAGALKPDEGTIEYGPGLKVGYYSQEHFESLNENNTPVDELNLVKPEPPWVHMKYLVRFGFDERISKSEIKYLSGGQRSRVQLAKFLILNPEVLLLDEPTNHLDIQSVEVLEKFLIEYEGALVLISHDRQLVSNVAQKIYSIEQGQLVEV
jgi:ATPase subunit of ABC transporter with duplicated ATPase domains